MGKGLINFAEVACFLTLSDGYSLSRGAGPSPHQ